MSCRDAGSIAIASNAEIYRTRLRNLCRPFLARIDGMGVVSSEKPVRAEKLPRIAEATVGVDDEVRLLYLYEETELQLSDESRQPLFAFFGAGDLPDAFEVRATVGQRFQDFGVIFRQQFVE
ncbi:hypothetical protein AB4Y36_24840 [Paraburkholderia sp. BR10936]|uniref:hypothetical protein n=1 Tax=Paraburkholderia sp. BR10936 TaxID=3236993 RepID=UPI0034D2F973